MAASFPGRPWPPLFWVSLPGRSWLLRTLWDDVWVSLKHFCCTLKHGKWFKKKKSISVIGLGAELVMFFLEQHIYLKRKFNWQTNYNYSDFGRHFVDIFSKTNQVRLTLQGKQLTAFVAKEKFEFSTRGLTASQSLTTFPMRLMVLLINVNFWYFKMKCIKIWKTSKTQWTSVFQISMGDVTISQMGKRAVHSNGRKDQWILM